MANELSEGKDKGRGVRRGVSKRIEDGRKPSALQVATPEMAVRPFWGWTPAGGRMVEHSRV
jgi:hypothetical protein